MFLLKVFNSLSVLYSVIKMNWCGLVSILCLGSNAVSFSGSILSALLSMTINAVTKHFLSELCWHADVKHGVISHWGEPGGLVDLSCLSKHRRTVASTQQWWLFAGSWRWQQGSGSRRSAPSALSGDFPAAMWSNRPSWAPHAVS